MNEVSLTMPLTRVLTDSLTHAYPKCKNLSLVFHPMTLYPKKKSFLCLKLIGHYLINRFIQSHWTISDKQLYSKAMKCTRDTPLDVVQSTELTTHSPRMMNDYDHVHTHLMRYPRAYEMKLCHSMPIPCHIYDECHMDLLNHA